MESDERWVFWTLLDDLDDLGVGRYCTPKTTRRNERSAFIQFVALGSALLRELGWRRSPSEEIDHSACTQKFIRDRLPKAIRSR